jgi:DNA-binding transcriptional LysR family regulator
MDRLHLMAVFVAVVENEGFASASRKLRLSPPAVSRAISELETRLGVKLLQRTTRHLQITEAGQRYYKDAKHIVALSEEAEDAVRGKKRRTSWACQNHSLSIIWTTLRHGRHYRLPEALSRNAGRCPFCG